jgi:hypothetical protein
MNTMTGLIWFAIAVFLLAIWGAYAQSHQTPEEKQKELYGSFNLAMKCPHCDQVGKIRTKQVAQKKGVSGVKATAAVLTGGV